MPSIEEAWVELAWEEAECFHERSGATDRDHVATKARALALAGFRAGWRAGSGAPIDHAERDYGAIGDPGCMCRYHAKCREIKELS